MDHLEKRVSKGCTCLVKKKNGENISHLDLESPNLAHPSNAAYVLPSITGRSGSISTSLHWKFLPTIEPQWRSLCVDHGPTTPKIFFSSPPKKVHFTLRQENTAPDDDHHTLALTCLTLVSSCRVFHLRIIFFPHTVGRLVYIHLKKFQSF